MSSSAPYSVLAAVYAVLAARRSHSIVLDLHLRSSWRKQGNRTAPAGLGLLLSDAASHERDV